MLKVSAVDLGASSGRISVGSFDGGKISLAEVYRFPNFPINLGSGVVWDFPRLFHEVKLGLRKMQLDYSQSIHSIGIDTWGLDFGLIGENGELISVPLHHRDPLNEEGMELVDRKLDRSTVYRKTGVQFMPVNTINQLARLVKYQPYLLDVSKNLLMMPDLFHFFLTGQNSSEYTIATTTQLLDVNQKSWDEELLDWLGLRRSLFTGVALPGTNLGPLRSEVQRETNLLTTRVISVATHDTASAVVGTPLASKNSLFISCGSWSLVGIEIENPIVNETTLSLNLSNEGGAFDTIRLLKNSMGLWLLQEVKRQYEALGDTVDFPSLVSGAFTAPAFKTFIFPDDPVFLPPNNMIERIQNWCVTHSLPKPETRCEIVRCILESLAMRYREILEEVEAAVGCQIDVIHIVGGGSQNELLCQWTANVTGRQVAAGPSEATSLGNMALQLYANREVSNLKEIREVINNSFQRHIYEPANVSAWEEQYRISKAKTQR
ncbi:rhamnulokinase [Alicyclobacillus dauci]|uniref:Rhamnulokinase n=1 Tax=Alicyclobacillus dauci TaxID=1475485 RepID=A0ABY6Z9D1_9BACL|nr:rhamnulokinase family protein [Alicyclobacillus dauci]WAH38864.1 rhamnulokinase [Alicyclobacillus dauci]